MLPVSHPGMSQVPVDLVSELILCISLITNTQFQLKRKFEEIPNNGLHHIIMTLRGTPGRIIDSTTDWSGQWNVTFPGGF